MLCFVRHLFAFFYFCCPRVVSLSSHTPGPLLCAEVKQSTEGGIKLAADSKFSRECVIVGSCEP